MRPDSRGGRSAAPRLAASALMTFVALYLVWAAFHDIAHGETDLTTEYTLLGISAAWLAYLALSLIWTRHRALGGVSLVALGAGLWGQRGVGAEGTAGLSSTYLATAAAFLWFLLLSGILAVLSWRAYREERKEVEA
jgi:hypothetical protein